MIIVGSLNLYFHEYYKKLKKMVMDLNLNDYVTFEIVAIFDKLLSFMRKCKAYFCPRSGEHFGMSIVETMSTGLISIVPDIGGQTEFVPSKYHFNTIKQAAKLVLFALSAPYADRIAISNSVAKFSTSNYKRRYQQAVSGLLESI